MSAGVEIRRMRLDDLAAVQELASSLKDAPAWPDAVYHGAIDPAGRPERICLTAVAAEGTVAGFLVASVVASSAELESIAVATQWQRRGIGRKLLMALAEELRARGAAELLLEVRASNVAARALYDSLGFAEVGQRKEYYERPREDGILLRLDPSSET